MANECQFKEFLLQVEQTEILGAWNVLIFFPDFKVFHNTLRMGSNSEHKVRLYFSWLEDNLMYF